MTVPFLQEFSVHSSKFFFQRTIFLSEVFWWDLTWLKVTCQGTDASWSWSFASHPLCAVPAWLSEPCNSSLCCASIYGARFFCHFMFLTWVPDELIIPAHGKGWNCADFCINSNEGFPLWPKEETHDLIDLKLQKKINIPLALLAQVPFSYYHLSVWDSPPSFASWHVFVIFML